MGSCYLLFRQFLDLNQDRKLNIIAIGHRSSSYLEEFRKKRRDVFCFVGEKYQIDDNSMNLFSEVIICTDEDLIDYTSGYCQPQRNRNGLVMEIARSNKKFVHEMIERVEKYCPDSLFFISIPPFSKLCSDDCKILLKKRNVAIVNCNEFLKSLDGTMLVKEAFELLDRWISDKMDEWFV